MTTLDSIVRRQEKLAARLGNNVDSFRRIVNDAIAEVAKGVPKYVKGGSAKTIALNIPAHIRADLEREQERLGVSGYREMIYATLLVGYRTLMACQPDAEPTKEPTPKPRVVWPPEARHDNIKEAVRLSKEPKP